MKRCSRHGKRAGRGILSWTPPCVRLNAEAWMHNRGRMIVASFLTKDLLIDWRWGERYFMQQLVDGDQAANNGGWQWAAGTGTDAQPFFRIFNPTTQGEKFDPDGTYVKRWVPELARVPANRVHHPLEALAVGAGASRAAGRIPRRSLTTPSSAQTGAGDVRQSAARQAEKGQGHETSQSCAPRLCLGNDARSRRTGQAQTPPNASPPPGRRMS